MRTPNTPLELALKNFTEAAINLDREWNKANKFKGEALENDGYPFHQDFGEMCKFIVQWKNASMDDNDDYDDDNDAISKNEVNEGGLK